MEWIEQVQRDLGAPVVDFAIDNWVLLVAVVAVAVWWLVNAGFGRTPVEAESGPTDADSGADGPD